MLLTRRAAGAPAARVEPQIEARTLAAPPQSLSTQLRNLSLGGPTRLSGLDWLDLDRIPSSITDGFPIMVYDVNPREWQGRHRRMNPTGWSASARRSALAGR
uniref:Uncharacterized protein n=1 Tax=Trichuris muris TaxID=70415 RepID=A0A5S6QHI1_TRIMR